MERTSATNPRIQTPRIMGAECAVSSLEIGGLYCEPSTQSLGETTSRCAEDIGLNLSCSVGANRLFLPTPKPKPRNFSLELAMLQARIEERGAESRQTSMAGPF